jgi:hypothetical protein
MDSMWRADPEAPIVLVADPGDAAHGVGCTHANVSVIVELATHRGCCCASVVPRRERPGEQLQECRCGEARPTADGLLCSRTASCTPAAATPRTGANSRTVAEAVLAADTPVRTLPEPDTNQPLSLGRQALGGAAPGGFPPALVAGTGQRYLRHLRGSSHPRAAAGVGTGRALAQARAARRAETC